MIKKKKQLSGRVAIWLHLSRIDKARLLQPTAEEMKGQGAVNHTHARTRYALTCVRLLLYQLSHILLH